MRQGGHQPLSTLPHHLLVQRLAHAVQALELVLLRRVALRARPVRRWRQRLRVVRRELRIDRSGAASSLRAQAM
jgi:hypothetical protein